MQEFKERAARELKKTYTSSGRAPPPPNYLYPAPASLSPPGPETRAGMRHSVPEVIVGEVPVGSVAVSLHPDPHPLHSPATF